MQRRTSVTTAWHGLAARDGRPNHAASHPGASPIPGPHGQDGHATARTFLSCVALAVMLALAIAAAPAQERGSEEPVRGAKPATGPMPGVGDKALPGPGPAGESKPAGSKEPAPKSTEKKGTAKKPAATTSKKPKTVRRVGPPSLEARLVEGGSLNLTLLDERVEFITPYGKLSIPMTDVQRVEFASRIGEEVVEQIDRAIRNLGADEFDVREKASADLLEFKERAYAALVKASEHSDPEVARRAEELLEKIREEVPEERLTPRENDVIHTKDSKFTGKLMGEALRVLTAQFGEQRLKFADVVSLGQAVVETESTASKNVIADPGTLHAYQAMVGATLTFKVTGNPGGSIWGTDMYTLDTRLATAAVHCGVLKPGETGNVRVQILGPQAAFMGSVRHGVTSSDYGGYPGAYRVLSSKK